MRTNGPDRQDQLQRLAALPDDRIETNDIPEASAEAWHHAHRPRLKATALAIEELDDATLRTLATSRMDSSRDRLNALMD